MLLQQKGRRSMRAAPAELPQPRTALREAIRESGLAAWQVGHLAALSPTQLSHIASGRRDVHPDEAQRLARVLGTKVDDLFPEGGP
jgi:plasmid maintenance system antidote protein VapI